MGQRLLAAAIAVHGGRYDYSRVAYLHSEQKVEIICPVHGSFFQYLNSHARGHGCDACARPLRARGKTAYAWDANRARIEKTLQQRCLSIDLLLETPVKLHTPVTVTCQEHGPYAGSIFGLWKGQGCWKCYVARRAGQGMRAVAAQTFIEKAKAKHGKSFDYSAVKYDKSSRKVEIVCPKHGPFRMSPNNHLKGEVCPTCAKQMSAAEKRLFEFVLAACPDAKTRVRGVVERYELDIYVPSKALAIEYNGIFWHSVKVNPDRQHLAKKQRAAQEVGIRLIHVLESEFEHKEALVYRMISHALGASVGARVFARKCVVSLGEPSEYKGFFDANHHQGFALRGGKVYALKMLDGTPVAALHVAPPKFYGDAKDRAHGVLEVVRYATSAVVVGGLTRLLAAVIKHAGPERLVSYVDNRWFTGRAYKAAGFEKVGDGTPGMMVFDKRLHPKHRAALTKPRLRQVLGECFDVTKTQIELAAMAGYHVLFDCGSSKYEFKSNRLPSP